MLIASLGPALTCELGISKAWADTGPDGLSFGSLEPLVVLMQETPPERLMPLLVNRALIRGFIVSDHPDREADFLRDVSGWLREGKVRYREDIVEGLEHAPRAFLGLFRGENFGKLIVRVGDDPTRGGA